MSMLAEMQLQRGAEHLHTLGPRAIAEFLTEISHTIGGRPAIDSLLNEYRRRLTPAMLRVTGGDRFPSRQLYVVGK